MKLVAVAKWSLRDSLLIRFGGYTVLLAGQYGNHSHKALGLQALNVRWQNSTTVKEYTL
jgi:hypothetical protein